MKLQRIETRTLKYQAPRREPVKTERGWSSKPWSTEGVLQTVRGGGWFGSDHDFESGVYGFALDASAVMLELRS